MPEQQLTGRLSTSGALRGALSNVNETSAAESAQIARDAAYESEAWAVGKRDGIDVDPSDNTYHNNSKYYAGRAEAASEGFEENLVVISNTEPDSEYNRIWIKETATEVKIPTMQEMDSISARMLQVESDVAEHDQKIEQNTQDITEMSGDIDDAKGAIESYDQTINQISQEVSDMTVRQETFCDELEVDQDGLVWLLNNGQRIAGPYGPFAGGGGGGGGGSSATLTVTNTTGWLSRTVAIGSSCEMSLSWSSIEDGIPTGDGTFSVTVNNSIKATQSVAQGNLSVDVGEYLTAGTNTVKLRISDVYGTSRTIIFSINAIALTLTSSFDTSTPFTGSFSVPYTPIGAISKAVYFVLDGTTLGSVVVSTSGRQLSYAIPAQSHGAHSLLIYMEAVINGDTVRSNELYFDIICLEAGDNDVIIASPFNLDTVEQYSSIVIPFSVYDPQNLTCRVVIKANGTTISTQTVDRTEHTYTYRVEDYGTLTITLTAGGTTKTLTVSVTESDVDAKAETEDLALYLTSKGRSNQEPNPGTWTYNDISATLSGFNFVSDGWQTDKDGITVLRVSGDARVTIPYKPFAGDARLTGKTIEVEFATRDVLNYDSTIIACLSGGRGLSVTAQKATLTSEQSEISTQYKEDEHVRVAFVIEKRSENRLVYIYINGIASGVVQYPADDDFSQASPVNISIGSSYCTTDIYCIRVYDNSLTRYQILDNWIADTQVGSLMHDRYVHNNVYDAYGQVVIAKLPTDLPYMIIECPELPQYKGDKKTISGSFVDPLNESKSFSFTGAQCDVQGTSSQYYPRKNYKIKFKNGFIINGQQQATYAMNADAIPTNTFTFKADVASSEGANNVELARLYNDVCPYKTPAQLQDAKVRQGIDGFPIVLFWNNGSTTQFMGKGNWNNDKGTPEVFGFVDGDESWEVKNNTSDRVIWKSADYTSSGWLDDFEARYPDTDPAYENNAQLAEFARWVVTTDTEAATGDALPSSVTYDGVTYTNDTAAYRLAKFKAEAGNYMELQSAEFYYLFTELFLMVDSRAKNAFPSFMGEEVVNGN